MVVLLGGVIVGWLVRVSVGLKILLGDLEGLVVGLGVLLRVFLRGVALESLLMVLGMWGLMLGRLVLLLLILLSLGFVIGRLIWGLGALVWVLILVVLRLGLGVGFKGILSLFFGKLGVSWEDG